SVRAGPARNVIVVHFTGGNISLDEGALDRIHEQLLAFADEPGEADLLLDFANVEYLTSTTLGTLISLHKKLLPKVPHLTVGNLSPQVHEVFSITKVDRFLDLRLAGQEDRPAVPKGQAHSAAGVLVVDDETAFLCVLAARLRIAGYKVWVADHGL